MDCVIQKYMEKAGNITEYAKTKVNHSISNQAKYELGRYLKIFFDQLQNEPGFIIRRYQK